MLVLPLPIMLAVFLGFSAAQTADCRILLGPQSPRPRLQIASTPAVNDSLHKVNFDVGRWTPHTLPAGQAGMMSGWGSQFLLNIVANVAKPTVLVLSFSLPNANPPAGSTGYDFTFTIRPVAGSLDRSSKSKTAEFRKTYSLDGSSGRKVGGGVGGCDVAVEVCEWSVELPQLMGADRDYEIVVGINEEGSSQPENFIAGVAVEGGELIDAVYPAPSRMGLCEGGWLFGYELQWEEKQDGEDHHSHSGRVVFSIVSQYI